MKYFGEILVTILAMVTSLPSQKIQTQTGDRNHIIHLQTALNHLTVIELNEPVVEVAAGSPSFKVEWRENKVFVQPTEADVRTDLFIWTTSRRSNYELEPAGSVEQMDFAVDEAALEAPPPKPALTPAPPSPTDVLLAGQPIRMENSKRSKRSVEIVIRDLYETDGRVFVRYAVRNYGTHPYSLDIPQVYVLHGARYPQSLYGLVNYQLADQQAVKLKVKEKTPVPVLESQLQASRIDPGQETLGVIALRLPSKREPTIFQFEFPSDDKGPIAAFLVR